jgi:hypothetical protein
VTTRERVHDRLAHALVELSRRQIVRNVEVQGTAHHALCDGEIEEALQLRGDAIIALELGEHEAPDRYVRDVEHPCSP